MFVARDRAEAEELMDRIMDAELAIVCPEDDARLVPCPHCNGTLVNPVSDDDETDDDATDDSRWAVGKPCVGCTDSPHPGFSMECARAHTASASIRDEGDWLSTEERRLVKLLNRILAAVDGEDVDSARTIITNELALHSPPTS